MINLSALFALLTAVVTVSPLSSNTGSATATSIARTSVTPSTASAINLAEAVRETVREQDPVDTSPTTAPPMTPTATLTPAPSHSAVTVHDDSKNQGDQTSDGRAPSIATLDEKAAEEDAAQPGQVTCDGTAGPDSTGDRLLATIRHLPALRHHRSLSFRGRDALPVGSSALLLDVGFLWGVAHGRRA